MAETNLENLIAGMRPDHLLVPIERADEAVEKLLGLSADPNRRRDP